MRFLGIIPARGGSKGISHKNIKEMAGKPLLAYTIEAAMASGLARTVVSTDDPLIEQVALRYGAEVVRRPPELARDDTPTRPVLEHALSVLAEDFDSVVTLQPTSPLRTAKHIDEALALFAAADADSLVSVIKVPHNFTPPSLMKKTGTYLENYEEQEQLVLRRQEKPILWARNGAAIYITRTVKLGQYIFGGKILSYEMSKLDSIDIDDMDDWVIAESLLLRRIT